MHRCKILTRQHLLTELWGACTYERIHSLHVYVAQLRQKIEPVPEDRRFILTIPGVGYRFADKAKDSIRKSFMHLPTLFFTLSHYACSV